MGEIYYETDADVAELEGLDVAIVGYGNQGRSWALNLRDSEVNVRVCVRADASREQAREDGFEAAELASASDADVACILVPDDVIPKLGLERPATGLSILASGYTLAFDRFAPAGDLAMLAPRMLGPEVRRCYEEGAGFITAVGLVRSELVSGVNSLIPRDNAGKSARYGDLGAAISSDPAHISGSRRRFP
jgi:ketol-acid reductoisomerase